MHADNLLPTDVCVPEQTPADAEMNGIAFVLAHLLANRIERRARAIQRNTVFPQEEQIHSAFNRLLLGGNKHTVSRRGPFGER